jgi:quercetin dioxygenase-like cupin family protein
MYFYDPPERNSKELAPGILARTFWGEKMLAAVVDLEPNTPLPRHSHPHEQIGIVLEGALELVIDEQKQTLTPGQLYIIPGGVEHSALSGAEGAKVMDVFSPVREEYKY